MMRVSSSPFDQERGCVVSTSRSTPANTKPSCVSHALRLVLCTQRPAGEKLEVRDQGEQRNAAASWSAVTESAELPLLVAAEATGPIEADPMSKAATAQTPSPQSKTWRSAEASTSGPLRFDLAFETPLRASLAADGQSVRFADEQGAAQFSFSKLVVVDANGKVIPARMEVAGRGQGEQRNATASWSAVTESAELPLSAGTTKHTKHTKGEGTGQSGLTTEIAESAKGESEGVGELVALNSTTVGIDIPSPRGEGQGEGKGSVGQSKRVGVIGSVVSPHPSPLPRGEGVT